MGVKEDFINKLNKDWTLVGEYTNVKTPTMFRHNKCGNTYLKTPSVVLNKPNSCRFCNAKNLTMSLDELVKKTQDKSDKYEVLSEPKGWDSKITVLHKVCGKIFEQRLGVFVKSKEGCPYCKNKLLSTKKTMSHSEFLHKLGDRAKEYEFLTEYKKAHEKIKVKHKCGNTFEMTPDSMLRGGRCKACKYSTGEGELFNEVKKISDDAIQGDRSILPCKREIDIYIPTNKIAIEYDGLRYHTVEHFMSDERRKWTYSYASKYHLWKTDECYKQGIRLLHFYEDEWLNKKDIVLDIIRTVLRVEPMKVYARKTNVAQITKKEADEFLCKNHIQGKVRAKFYIGLFIEGELIAVQTYSSLRKSLGGKNDDEWELTRYATKLGYSVIGGFSKCLSYFCKHNDVARIISYGDLRIIDRDNNVYIKNGFNQTRVCSPSYYYVKNNKRYHRFDYRKQVIERKYNWVYDDKKTEKEMMRELGYERIYDCGKIRYEYVYNK